MHHHAVAAHLDLIGFLVLGMAGSVAHCAAMCSPFVLFVSARYARPATSRAPLAAQAWYAGGRLTTYALLGAAAGALGGTVQMVASLAGLQRAAAIVAGTLLVGSAIAALSQSRFKLDPHAGWFGAFTRRLYRRVPGHPYVIGLILGLLPCGLLYTAVVAAVATGGAAAGALALAAFGIGTVPALFGVAFANELVFKRREFLTRAVNVFVLVMGAWYLWQGLS
jgi:sulfite exporter TauE/SafE